MVEIRVFLFDVRLGWRGLSWFEVSSAGVFVRSR